MFGWRYHQCICGISIQRARMLTRPHRTEGCPSLTTYHSQKVKPPKEYPQFEAFKGLKVSLTFSGVDVSQLCECQAKGKISCQALEICTENWSCLPQGCGWIFHWTSLVTPMQPPSMATEKYYLEDNWAKRWKRRSQRFFVENPKTFASLGKTFPLGALV